VFLPEPEKPWVWAYLKRHLVKIVMREVHVISPCAQVGRTSKETVETRDLPHEPSILPRGA
jgi:hypothetical protein